MAQNKAPCRTDGCDGDPDDGEGWDGFCGNCADAIQERYDDEHEDETREANLPESTTGEDPRI